MIERFNFYDVYGYLLPGLTWIGLICLLITPTVDLGRLKESAALATLVLLAGGYLLGHILQILSDRVLPSKVRVTGGTLRYPSDFVLDDSDESLVVEVKRELKMLIARRFKLDMKDGSADDKILRRRRGEAFLLCRSFLVQNKLANYAEQMQGMYVMMRGLCAAFGSAAMWYFGFLLTPYLSHNPSFWLDMAVQSAAILVFCFAFVATDPGRDVSRWAPRALVGSGVLAILSFSWSLDLGVAGTRGRWLAAVAIVSALLSLLCHRRYRWFALQFALAVYRAYLVAENRDLSLSKEVEA